MKIEPGVGSGGGREHAEGSQALPFPAAVLNINSRLRVGFWQERLIIEDQNISSVMVFF
jgi:hypothetical protein